MPGFENFITQTFRAPNPAEVDRARYSNALAKNQVARIPQANKAQDLAIQGDEQALGQNRQASARKFLGDVFTGIAESQDPINTGRTILGNSSFQAALRDVGMDPAQFTITDKDTPESLASQSRDLARMMGGQTIDQRQRVQSTQVLADNTIAIVTDDGRIIRTNEKARTPQQPGEPLEQTVGADGRPVLTPRSQAAGQTPYAATAAKPQTEGDKRNSLMFDSMVNAEQQIAGMNAAGNTTDTSSKKDALLGLAGLSVAQSDDYKQYEAAGLRWAANLLYLKSGATATPDEIRSTWKQFFPQPGDGPANVQQKNAARVQEMQSAGRIVGRDVPQFGGGEVAPEGTVITSQDGRTMVKRNGQWVPQ